MRELTIEEMKEIKGGECWIGQSCFEGTCHYLTWYKGRLYAYDTGMSCD